MKNKKQAKRIMAMIEVLNEKLDSIELQVKDYKEAVVNYGIIPVDGQLGRNTLTGDIKYYNSISKKWNDIK